MQFSDAFLRVAGTALARQDEGTGAMPPGHNGPYHDPETPVRNTSHWIQSFLAAYRLSGDHRFVDAARKCAEYLVGPNAPRNGPLYYHRKKEGKDSCNGLIGPAWTIEGMSAAYDFFGDRNYFEFACDYFFAHPFSSQAKRWSRVDADGTELAPDLTFNHQLWFCMAGAILGQLGQSAGMDRANEFLGALRLNLSTKSNGRIQQPVADWRILTKRAVKQRLKPDVLQGDRVKEVGYHSFNLYAFTVLFKILPEHPFWSSKWWKSILGYQGDGEYTSLIGNSPYGFPYNPPGFEIPFVNDVFDCSGVYGLSDEEWIGLQMELALDKEEWMLSLNNPDPETMTARIYECARFSDRIFSLRLPSSSELPSLCGSTVG